MQNVLSGQQQLLDRLRATSPNLVMRWDEARGVIRLIRNVRGEGDGSATSFLSAYASLFGPRDLVTTLRLLHTRTDRRGGTHVEYQQEYVLAARGRRSLRVPVYASRVGLHFTPAGALVEVWSNCWRDVAVHAGARVTMARAGKLLGLAGLDSARRARARRPGEGAPETPRLVIYPWRGGFRLAWTAYGYARVAGGIEPGDVFVDATTGELFQFFPVRLHVAGSGRGVTPVGGPYVLRTLEVEPVGAGPAHVLRDTSRPRHIVTYHDACAARAGEWWTRCDALMTHITNPATSPAANATGPNWLTTAATTAPADREASQQPEVDAHFFAGEAYDWYAAVGGRVGWDNGEFPGSVEQNLPVRVVTHTRDTALATAQPSTPSTCHTAYSQFWRMRLGGFWRAYIMFCDGNPPPTSSLKPNRIDFPAGSRALVGHEYQHVVTYFSFRNDQTPPAPGIGYDGWAAAFHEGLADAFGCMFAEHWLLGLELSHETPPVPIRNLAYPRDPASWENRPGGLGHQTLDHFDDRTQPPPGFGWSRAYDHGAILAHAAFLMAAGGVRRREGYAGQAPLIPVGALAVDTVNGRRVSRAARIWYDGLESFSETLGQVTASSIDENIFRGFRDACESAALAAYGAGSVEHCTTLLAFHAVGLDDPDVPYGPDLTFLRWAVDWQLSKPYLGGIRATCPNWSSIDLFINNGGSPGWNAVIDAPDGPNALPLGFENRVYCRVRNVGDAQATGITVKFFWAKVGSAPTSWEPVKDKQGVVQELGIAALGAGAISFEESQQDTPPASAGVLWYIPPLAAGETVDHFCLKAVVESADDVNPHNNDVQSNVTYTVLATQGARRLDMDFLVGNPRAEPIDVVTAWQAPPGWDVEVEPGVKRLRAGEERLARLTVRIPAGAATVAPPLDGEVRGRITGPVTGRVIGALTGSVLVEDGVTGRVSLDVEGVGVLLGTFVGRLDMGTGLLEGRVNGVFQGDGGKDVQAVVAFAGGLRPWRRVDVSQLSGGEALGGFTLEFRLPAPPGGQWPPDPPSDISALGLAAGSTPHMPAAGRPDRLLD